MASEEAVKIESCSIGYLVGLKTGVFLPSLNKGREAEKSRSGLAKNGHGDGDTNKPSARYTSCQIATMADKKRLLSQLNLQ